MPAASSHGPGTRRPVVYGGRPIPSLWQRALKDGTTVYEASLRIDGKKKRVVLTARTVTEAIRELEALRVDRDRGVAPENPLINPTIAELFEELLDHMQSRVGIRDEKRRYSQRTVDGHRETARMYIIPFMGHRRVGGVTVPDLRLLVGDLQAKDLAPSTATRVLVAVSAALTFAAKRGYVPRNVCRDLPREDRPGAKRLTEPRYLSADEVERLLDDAEGEKYGYKYRPMFGCMAFAGLRISETLGVTWKNLDFKGDEITVTAQLAYPELKLVPTKTARSASTIVMAPALKRDLLRLRSIQAEQNLVLVQPDALVFVTRDGTPYDHTNVRAILRRICHRAGLNPPGLPLVSPHDLRHTAIALAIQSGAPITEVCEFARHVSPDVTLRAYAGLAKDARGGAMRRMLEAGYGL